MSWMMSGWGLGGIIGVLVALRIRPKRPLVAAVALTPIIGLWMLATGLKFPLPALVILAVGSGIALDTFYVLWLTTMQREIPEDIRSRVGAYDAFGSSLFAPLGLFLAGPIATWAGASGTLIVVGIIVAVAWISTLLSRGVRSVSA
jgi:MFS family permease